MEINKEKNTVECMFIHFFFREISCLVCSKLVLLVLLESLLIVNYYGVGWKDYLRSYLHVEIGLCFLVVSLEMLDKSNQSNNNRIKSDEDCRSSSRNVCHFY